jgi:hypothetical protein
LSIGYGLTSSNSIGKESSCKYSLALGEGTMIVLLVASAISLAATQASIAGPTDAFRGCLREAAVKAKSDKVSGDGIEAYLKNACTAQMGSLKEALVAFRMKNGMSRKSAGDDAQMTVDDYVATPASMAAPKAASAPAPPAPTPASVSTTPATQPPKP